MESIFNNSEQDLGKEKKPRPCSGRGFECRPSSTRPKGSISAPRARRRRARDPDLWVIELDIAGAERFAAETILGG